jgi:acyl-CoA reductase-like NAD-dependent aldehyde dehydrogenase
MKDAAESLTPVTLELGGKDPFVVCSDVKLCDVVPTALRAAFQSCGQNCVAAERFIVHEAVYEDFLAQCASVVQKMRQGDPLGAYILCAWNHPAAFVPAHCTQSSSQTCA